MASDPNPALRAELNAALAEITPQIRGLHDLASVSISADLSDWVATQITTRERRRDLIRAVVGHLDNTLTSLQTLEADGYPVLVPVTVPSTVMSELQGEVDDLTAAASVFTADVQASRLTIGLGAPIAKSKTPPQS